MSVMLYRGDTFKVFPNDDEAGEAMRDGWFDNPTDARAAKPQEAPKAKRGRPAKVKANEDVS